MATESITQFPVLSAGQVANNDVLPIVDVTDLSSPTGTTKKVTVDGLLYPSVPREGRTVATLQDYLSNNAVVFNVKDFGAVLDGVTDDRAAWLNAADAAAALASSGAGASAPVLYIPPSLGCACAGPVTVAANVAITMDAPLIKTYTDDDTFLTIGSPSTPSIFRSYLLDVRRATQSTWASETDIGVVAYNFIDCWLDLRSAQNFTIGFQGRGDTTGWVYNHTVLGYLANNLYGIDLVSNGVGGFVNQNDFYSGRAHIDSPMNSAHPATERFAVRIRSEDGTYTGNNNNTFYSPSWELGSTTGIGLLVQDGGQNRVVYGRAEVLKYALRVENASSNNSFLCGYNDSSAGFLDDQSTVGGNYVIPALGGAQQRFQREVFRLDNILDNYAPENASNINIANCSFLTGSGPIKSINGITVGTNYLGIPSASPLGIVVDTTVNNEFVLYMNGTNSSFRAIIQCYDAAGAILTNSAPDYPNVKGDIASQPYLYSASFGGIYATQSDGLGPFYMKFNSSVATAWIGLGGGSGGAAQLTGFSIYTTPTGVAPRVVSGHTGLAEPTVTQSPQLSGVGTWSVGKFFPVTNPSVQGILGYSCGVAGSPGTWYIERGLLAGAGTNRGDNDVTLTSGEFQVQRFATTLTANRTVTLPSANLSNGLAFRIVRTGLGAFTLTVQTATPTTLKVMPSGTAAFVDVICDGTNWFLTAYGAL